MLVYFGFTFCPDVCPQELLKIAEVQEKLKSKGLTSLIPVFVTLDPRRDTCAQVCNYGRSFFERFRALTGSPESIKRICRLFRVYYNDGTTLSEDDYLIDHSIIHYLIGPDGEFLDFFGKSMTVDEIVSRIVSITNK